MSCVLFYVLNVQWTASRLVFRLVRVLCLENSDFILERDISLSILHDLNVKIIKR